MRISGGMNAQSINSFFNALGQNKMSLHANRLSNSNFVSNFTNNASSPGSAGSSDAGKFVSSIRSASESLTDVLRQLTSSGNRVVALSSNDAAVSIQHTGVRPSGVSRMEVSVFQLASGQVNEGASMQSDAVFEGNTGTNQFSITQGNITRTFNLNIEAGATNADVQRQMASAINSANLGFSASVVRDAETNTSMLRIESSAAGALAENAFSLSDVSGNLVASMGANDMASAAQNARFSVNDGPIRESSSNTVFIGNGVTATFNAVTENPVGITWGRNESVSHQSIRDLVSSFNELFSAASSRTGDARAQNLASRLLNVVTANSSALSEIGISFNANGNLTINSTRLEQATNNGRLDEFFGTGSRSSGFASQLSRIAESVTRNPSSFVTNATFGNQNNFNQLGSGLMFDFTF